MGVHEGRGQLSRAMKDLMSRWQEAKSVWTDVRADAFEKRFIHMIEQDLKSTFAAMDHIGQVLGSARRDCE